MEALEVKNMTVFEARECVKQINENIHNVRALLLDLYERKGWEALGYESWRACAVGEFKGKENYLYKQLAAAKAEKNICTMVQNSEPIPERVLRPLTSIPPEEQREIYQEAQETAPDGKVTAKHIEEIIKQKEVHRPKLANYQSPKIAQRFSDVFNAMVEEIKRENLNGWKETDKATAKEMMANLLSLIQ